MEKFGLSRLTHSQEIARSNRAVATTLLGIQNGKKVNKILLISKEIAHKLNKEFCVPFGENGISSTGKLNGRHKYYLCESRKNLSLLKRLEK